MRRPVRLAIVALMSASAAGVDDDCDHDRLRLLPEHAHPSWCRVLQRCDVLGEALLATAVNCTTRNTFHFTNWVTKHSLEMNASTLARFQNSPQLAALSASGLPTPTERMCNQPACMRAVTDMYEVALNTPDWLAMVAETRRWMDAFQSEAKGLRGAMNSGSGLVSYLAAHPEVAAQLGLTPPPDDASHGSGRALSLRSYLPQMPVNATKLAALAHGLAGLASGEFKHAVDLAKAARGMTNAVQSQLESCMRDAAVDEADLGLPVPIAQMTGGGRFFSAKTLREKSCQTMLQWVMGGLEYYSGYDYALREYDGGGHVGVVIAIVIGCANLVCCLGCLAVLLVCIRRRACYFCMKELAPGCADCLVECGCGPKDAERLNNEVVLNSSSCNHVSSSSSSSSSSSGGGSGGDGGGDGGDGGSHV